MYLCTTVDIQGIFCVVVMVSLFYSLFIFSNRLKPVRLHNICHKHIEICAISRPPVTGHEQQSTGYPLNRHRSNCKYSVLALLLIQLKMASSDLVNYIMVTVGSYSCLCAKHGDI
jgi:hypothetical protein